jgi:hypothetical protein
MSLSISPTNPSIVVDDSGRTLSFVPRDGSTPESFANAPQWALDFIGRCANNSIDSVEAALLFVGFKPDADDVTGPQIDGRLKRRRQLSQHDAQTGLPASRPTLALLDRRLTVLTSDGPAAGVSTKVIDEMTERSDLVSDQATASMVIGQIERVLVRRGLLAPEESQEGASAPASTPSGPADAVAGSTDIDWKDE